MQLGLSYTGIWKRKCAVIFSYVLRLIFFVFFKNLAEQNYQYFETYENLKKKFQNATFTLGTGVDRKQTGSVTVVLR